MDVRLPDGTVIQGVPDGTTKADLAAKLKSNGMAVPSEWLETAPKQDPAVSVGRAVMDIPRQVGLTVRAGAKGVMALPGAVVDAVTGPINTVFGTKIPTSAQSLDRALTAAGLPEPTTPTERVVQDAASMMAGAGAMAKGADVLGRSATGATKNVLEQLAARPGVQLGSAAGAGLAGGSVREAGGGPGAQFLASLGGGLAGGVMADRGIAAGNAIANLVRPKAAQMQAADVQINMILDRSGIDWKQVPERIRQGMRTEVADALATGQPLNADAVRRMYYFKATGTTPTVGMLRQDPGLITREQNLAKTGANSTDVSLQRLPNLQSDNTAQLLRQLDEAGAAGAPTGFQTGERIIGSLQGKVDAAQSGINNLYSAARDTSGRSAPLNGSVFTQRANKALDQAMVGGALPKDVANTMNRIATGEMPFTVEIAEQMKTRIGQLQRAASDGTTRMALGVVRRALDETPIQQQAVNPGNLPAVPGTVPPSAVGVGEDSIAAFNAARSANRQFMQRVENNPALKAVVDGAEPDQFVQKFVLGKGATASDLRALRSELEARTNPGNLPVPYDPAKAGTSAAPDALQSIKQYLVRYLKAAATNNTDDINKFSNASYRQALRDIGDEKLSVFFGADELRKLKDIGEAAKYMQAQPAGSAVNNSNSGALMLGRGMDMLDSLANYIPLGGRDIIKGKIQGIQQAQVLSPKNALLLAAEPTVQPVKVNPLLAAAISPSVDRRDDDSGDKPAKKNRVK